MKEPDIRSALLDIPSTAAAFLRMDFVEDVNYPMSFLFQQLRIVFPIFIFFFIGGLVGDSPLVGGDYFSFAVIGLSMTAVLQGALGGFGTALQRSLNRGNLETLLVEPVPWAFLPFAMNLWRMLLGLFSGGLILLVGLLLGARYQASGIPAFLVLITLGVLASTAIGVLSASVLVLAKKSQPILFLYGLAASLLAGSLFSVDQLPAWLRIFSWAIPHTYVINAARDVLMPDPGTFVIPFLTAVAALAVFNVVVFASGLWFFTRSLEYARKMGTLSGY